MRTPRAISDPPRGAGGFACLRLFIGVVVVVGVLAASKTDFAHLGPAVGQPMPDFSAPDQSGNVRSLKGLLKSNGAVLVFFRSADW